MQLKTYKSTQKSIEFVNNGLQRRLSQYTFQVSKIMYTMVCTFSIGVKVANSDNIFSFRIHNDYVEATTPII